MHHRRFLALACLAALSAIPFTHADVLPFGLKIEKVLDTTLELSDLHQSPSGEQWMLERTTGVVKLYRAGAQVASLTVPVFSTCESGLLGVAFAPDHAVSGKAFLYYVDTAKHARVDVVTRTAAGVELGSALLDLGVTAGGCRPGGGIAIGPDGKLYIGVGDLETSANGQNMSTLAGKVLRANLDGSVPADNPTVGSLVFARGFRDAKDLVINPRTARVNGTVYATDLGTGTTAHDEVNQVTSGGNYAWDAGSGPTGSTSDIDPLASYSPVVKTEGLAALTRSALGFQDSLVYTRADTATDDLRRQALTGAELDQASGSPVAFYDPDGDTDGTPDTLCPKVVQTLDEAPDGWLYLANTGANPGLWRIWRDTAGAREVSAAGSPYFLTVNKSGTDVVIGWEHLGSIDAGRPTRNGGQRTQVYEVWEGSLPIGSYDHAGVLSTDGNPDGLVRRNVTMTPGSGSRYFLVSAQGDNMEGSLGRRSTGEERPGRQDWCDVIGRSKDVGDCLEDFRHPVTGASMKLVDYNPRSATYMQSVSFADFRGRVLKVDLSADNCFWCNVQADQYHTVDLKYRDQDFSFLTILALDYATLAPIAPGNCATVISDWATTHNEDSPILCDVDLNGDNRADVITQLWHGPDCGGTPQNFYVDQGHVTYQFACGAQLGSNVETAIASEINPESCN